LRFRWSAPERSPEGGRPGPAGKPAGLFLWGTGLAGKPCEPLQRSLGSHLAGPGWVAERLKAPVLKTAAAHLTTCHPIPIRLGFRGFRASPQRLHPGLYCVVPASWVPIWVPTACSWRPVIATRYLSTQWCPIRMTTRSSRRSSIGPSAFTDLPDAGHCGGDPGRAAAEGVEARGDAGGMSRWGGKSSGGAGIWLIPRAASIACGARSRARSGGPGPGFRQRKNVQWTLARRRLLRQTCMAPVSE
jgi:hypothetical protein